MKKNFNHHPLLINFIFLIVTIFSPTLGWAHPNHSGYQGFSQGLLHPLSGLDHTLAMVAIGILASQKNLHWLWALPLTFITFMITGGQLGYIGMTIPWVELGITLSVLILGLGISFPHFISSLPLFIMVAYFGLCHGFAHGAEMPMGIPLSHYVLGFIIATLFLHLLGIMIGKIFIRKQIWILRLSGLAMAMCTLWL